MPASAIFPEFRDEQLASRYPFADDATLTNGTVSIPPQVFLDAALHLVGASAAVYLQSVQITPSGVTFVVKSLTGVAEASASVDLATFEGDLLHLADARGMAAGVLVVDPESLAVFGTWLFGSYEFQASQATFAAGVTMPVPAVGVRTVAAVDGTKLTGDVWLVGDRGVVFREEAGCVRVDIIGDPLFVRQLCDPLELFHTPRLLQTINDCGPDAYGNFQLSIRDDRVPTTAVRLFADQDGVLTLAAIGVE